MNKILLSLLITIFFTMSLIAQQSLFGGQEIVSPEIHEDNSVTFRVHAPDAAEVKLSGEWMPAEGWTPGSVSMDKDEKGVWTYTTGVLEPELYSYFILVDGVRTIDPGNPFIVRDVSSTMNIFIIGGGNADLYKVNQVPHGTVARRWYSSPAIGRDRRITIYTPPGYEGSN